MAEVQAPGMVTGPSGRRAHGEQYWREQVEAWRVSGLTQSEYCRRGGVNWYGFRYWKGKVDFEVGSPTPKETKLVAVKVPRAGGGRGEIRIRVGGRYVVEVAEGFEGSTLRQVLDLLERR
jgi:hypothetical protein